MANLQYDINLNHLTAGERFTYPETFENYKKMVLLLLDIQNLYEFEDEIINQYKDDAEVQRNIAKGMREMEAIMASFPDTYFTTGKTATREEQQKTEKVWFNISKDYYISSDDPLYDLFLALKLRQTDLLKLDDLLDYYLENAPENNEASFFRFLRLTLRKHSEKLFQPEQIDTINEWIVKAEKKTAISAEDTEVKSRVKRERDDKLTVLNQEQTALLIYCLRKSKVILTEKLLNNKEAGRAFYILTGYSADTIRQNLSKTEVAKTANIRNIEAVEQVLKDLLQLIERDIKPE